MMDAVDVVVGGGAGLDYTASGRRLPAPNTPVTIDVLLTSPGGKGLNQAVAAARLGARVALIACVGRDAAGDEVLDTAIAEGVDVTDRLAASAAARAIRTLGPAAVIIGAPDGRLFAMEAAEHWFPNLPIDVVDLTGAGDAFAGAFAVALVEGHSLRDSVAFGHAAAAQALTRLGALPSLPHRQEVLRLLERQALLPSAPS